MKNLILSISIVCLACIGCADSTSPDTLEDSTLSEGVGSSAWHVQTPMGEPLAGEIGAVLKAAAIVEGVDQEKRLLTLKKADGGSMTLRVGPEVKRLAEIKPGDSVVAEFVNAVTYEVREPTAEERAQPQKAVLVAGRTDSSLPPGAGATTLARGVVSIVALDQEAKTVTIKAADGKTTVLTVNKPENFERMHIGDTAVITYMEATALRIEPAQK